MHIQQKVCKKYFLKNHKKKQALGVEGGDWFCMECLNINSSLKRENGIDIISKMWNQSKYSNLSACLKVNLALDNSKIIDGVGYYLFSCLAYFKYGYKCFHDMRKYLYKKLIDLVLTKKFQGRLSYNLCPKMKRSRIKIYWYINMFLRV